MTNFRFVAEITKKMVKYITFQDKKKYTTNMKNVYNHNDR